MPVLLRFVVVYMLFDCANLVFSFALRGAGDTHFVVVVGVALAWPIMVAPTVAACYYQWGLYTAWAFASLYIMLLAMVFCWRFRQGKWRAMRVIEVRSQGCLIEDQKSGFSILRTESTVPSTQYKSPSGIAESAEWQGEAPVEREV